MFFHGEECFEISGFVDFDASGVGAHEEVLRGGFETGDDTEFGVGGAEVFFLFGDAFPDEVECFVAVHGEDVVGEEDDLGYWLFEAFKCVKYQTRLHIPNHHSLI